MNAEQLSNFYPELDLKNEEQRYYLMRLTALWGDDCLDLNEES